MKLRIKLLLLFASFKILASTIVALYSYSATSRHLSASIDQSLMHTFTTLSRRASRTFINSSQGSPLSPSTRPSGPQPNNPFSPGEGSST
ncbi:hypothetical protein AXFE_16090 [Acidithrix ferrooxidans]|uniref:Uncharacterized protein n=1 Tax=Acidithrix ferrooxidans TaxID=1280514 RepID=A0A0D8HI01_9ACTN|nr:hypothetical protein AXFE_16090 [Acidithrix ferrooxidans]